MKPQPGKQEKGSFGRMAAVLALASAVTAMTMGQAAPQDSGTTQFVAEPAPGSHTDADGSYFLLDDIGPDHVDQTLALRNDSTKPIDLRVAPVDASTGPLGGASYGLPGDRPTGVGAWIDLQRRRVVLEAGASALIPWTLRPPTTLADGEYLGGLAVWSPSDQGDAPSGPGASIDVQSRRVIAVLVRIGTGLQPDIRISGVTPAARPDGLYLEVGIANEGNALTTGEGTIAVGEGFDHDFTIDTFVPGTSIAYPIKWREVEEGTYDASVEIEYGDGLIATWEGSFSVGSSVLRELTDRGAREDAPGIPWVALVAAGLAVLLLVLLAILVLRRRRRVRVPAPVATRPMPAETPARTIRIPEARRDPSMPPPPPPPPMRTGRSKHG